MLSIRVIKKPGVEGSLKHFLGGENMQFGWLPLDLS